jgi:Uma2 family endonuclease
MDIQFGRRLTVDEYFDLPPTSRPMELVHGVVREPPAPFYPHQAVVTRLSTLLYGHVQQRRLGHVCVAPVDVVLNRESALVVQPDILFVARERQHIITTRVWGAPDLTVEVLSAGTASRDRTVKLGWYRQYDVRECWLVDVNARAIEVVNLAASSSVWYRGDEAIHSVVLPEWLASPDFILAVE